MFAASSSSKSRWVEIGLLSAILVLAATFRFWALDQWPPGLYRDEAIEGLDALRILVGERPVFWEEYDLGREVLFSYLVAPSIQLIGRSPLAIRLVSALLGTLTVGAIFFMSRLWFDRRIGLLAAAITSLVVWPINLSRVGMRMVTLPLLYSLAAGFLWLALRDGKHRYWIAVGVLYGLSFYTYASAHFGLILGLAFGLVLLRVRPRSLRQSELLVLVTSFLLVIAPLALFALGHPDSFWVRPAQKSILNPEIHGGDPLGFIVRNLVSTSLMFTTTGDFNPRHNVPLRPVFDPFLAAFFVIGVGVSLRRARTNWPHRMVLLWLGIMLLPTLLAEDAPHFSRSVGAMPVAMLLPGMGIDSAVGWVQSRYKHWAWPICVGVLPLLTATSLTLNDYFVRHLRSQNTYFHFEAGVAELAQVTNRFLGTGWTGEQGQVTQSPPRADRKVYLVQRLWDSWVTLRFLVPPSSGLEVVDPSHPLRFKEPEVEIIAWPYEDNRALWSALPSGSQVRVQPGSWEQGDLDPEPRLVYVSYRIVPYQDRGARAEAIFGEGIHLLNYTLSREADRIQVELEWRAESRPVRDLSVFVHLIEDSELVAQGDGPPAYGFYPTSQWRPGLIVLDQHTLVWRGPLDPSRHRILVGLYRLDTLERLPAHDERGEPMGDSVILEALAP